MNAGSHHNMERDVARGHSQTWEFGSTPRVSYTVRALLSEGQKLFHRQQEASRQEAWRQAEWGVWVQTLPCPSYSFLADTKGSWRTMNTLPHFKNLAWNNYSVSQFSMFNKNTEENVRPDQGGGTASTKGMNRQGICNLEKGEEEWKAEKREMYEASAPLFYHKTWRGSDKTSRQQV